MSDNSWHLSKSVPIAFIFAIFLQTLYFGWYASEGRSDITHNTQAIAKNESKITALELKTNKTDITLSRIDANIEEILRRLDRQERKGPPY